MDDLVVVDEHRLAEREFVAERQLRTVAHRCEVFERLRFIGAQRVAKMLALVPDVRVSAREDAAQAIPLGEHRDQLVRVFLAWLAVLAEAILVKAALQDGHQVGPLLLDDIAHPQRAGEHTGSARSRTSNAEQAEHVDPIAVQHQPPAWSSRAQ
jgi:hypothetical protein